MALTEVEVTAMRAETPGHAGWSQVATPGAANKYFMVSADCHIMEPPDLYAKRVESEVTATACPGRGGQRGTQVVGPGGLLEAADPRRRAHRDREGGAKLATWIR